MRISVNRDFIFKRSRFNEHRLIDRSHFISSFVRRSPIDHIYSFINLIEAPHGSKAINGLSSVLKVIINLVFSLLDNENTLSNLDLTQEGLFAHSIDSEIVSDHQSITFGLRELDSMEIVDLCSTSIVHESPPILYRSFLFSSDFYLRTYLSSCYFLHSSNQWNSQGLRVKKNRKAPLYSLQYSLGWTKNKSIKSTMSNNKHVIELGFSSLLMTLSLFSKDLY